MIGWIEFDGFGEWATRRFAKGVNRTKEKLQWV